ncbi:MAG: FliM/FliN family flagellar motor switch protein [Planctomycetales bacterium]|nr:FliM/FliN family flagellar motor switch protein [Planctomycetales bacterium]
MTFPADIADKMLDACRAGAGEAAGSMSTALDESIQFTEVQPLGPLPLGELPDTLAGPGLVLLFEAGGEAAALIIAESTNLLPPWYASPDATGEAKLQTLAQELSMLILPEDLAVGKFSASAVEDLFAAVRRGSLGDPAEAIAFATTGKGGEGALHLLWPFAQPGDIADPPEVAMSPAAKQAAKREAAEDEMAEFEEGLERLPGYSRSLLSIRVPVMVSLAQTKMRAEKVVELGPGAIIQFDKRCEEMLQLEAGGRVIAEGEAVKVGEKFGLRISAIQTPEDRFIRVVG